MATTGDQGNDSEDGAGGAGTGGDTGSSKDVNLNINVSGVKGDDTDHSKVDTSKLAPEELRDYNDKLKDENARRRIANKKLTDESAKLKESQAAMQKTLDELKVKADEDEKNKKELSLKEKSEIEQLQIRLNDLEKSINDKDTELTTLRSEGKKKDSELYKKSRENFIDRLVRAQDFEFSSDYERNGFIGDLLKTNTDGDFEKNDEEVILEINQLIKARGGALKTPGAGPKGKMAETPLVAEVNALLAKPNLNTEERARLAEITDEIEKAQAGRR